MQTAYSSDVQEIAAGFTPFADDVVPGEPTGRSELIAADAQRELGAAFQASGWGEIAETTDADDGFALVNAVVEQSAARRYPFPYPLVEALAARRALAVGLGTELRTALAGPLAAAELPVLVLDALAPDILRRVARDRITVALPRAADVALVVIPRTDGASVSLVRPDEAGGEPGVATDATLPVVRVELDVAAPGTAVEGELSTAIARRLVAERLTLETAELLGSSRWLFETTLGYLKSREQFGRRISSFQAIQHRMARLFVDLETTRSLHLRAIAGIEESAPDTVDVALLVKGFAGRTAKEVADQAIQLHGGMGFTWEQGLHWNVRRIYHRLQPPFSPDQCLAGAGHSALERGHAMAAAS